MSENSVAIKVEVWLRGRYADFQGMRETGRGYERDKSDQARAVARGVVFRSEAIITACCGSRAPGWRANDAGRRLPDHVPRCPVNFYGSPTDGSEGVGDIARNQPFRDSFACPTASNPDKAASLGPPQRGPARQRQTRSSK